MLAALEQGLHDGDAIGDRRAALGEVRQAASPVITFSLCNHRHQL